MTTPLAYSPQMVGKAAPSSSFQMGSPSQSAKKMILMPAASNLPSKDSPFFQTASVPIPPPMPSDEDLNKHYLIPAAPPMPREGELNKHYLARDKTVENAKASLSSTATFISEVAQDLTFMATQGMKPSSSSSSVPIPPPMPSDEDLNKHYLIPAAPPMPTEADLNKNYLARDKTVENAKGFFSSTLNYMSEVAHELVEDAKYYAPSILHVSSTSSTPGVIPVPPPMPTREAMHKHYLIPLAPPMPTREAMNKHYLSRNKTLENTGSMLRSAATYVNEVAHELVDPNYGRRVPIPPPMPSDEDMHKHYLIPLAPPMPTEEAMNKHYLSRNKTLENTGNMIHSAANYVSEMTHELVEDAKLYAPSLSTRQAGVIPIPPPMPSDESTHKHYLIPAAPPMPKRQATNKHYLSRDKTVENAGSMIQSAANYVSEVAHELVEDVKYYAPSLSRSAGVIPVPPPMPSDEDLNKHYLIPAAPPMPTKEAMNKHYLSRNKTLENASMNIRSAANYVGEVMSDAKQYATSISTPVPSILKNEEQWRSIPNPPPMPSDEDLHKHYLIPLAPPMPTREAMNKHYLSRDKTVENTGNMLRSAANYVSEVAHELVDDVKYYAPSLSRSSGGIPVPPPMPTEEDFNKHYLIPLAPPMPTREDMHKHYLIPLAPPMPTKEAMNKHYLSRNKTLENTGNMLRSAANYVIEVAHELADPNHGRRVPIPPPMPSDEDFNKHYLIPLAPPMPTKEAMNKHYLSRNKTLENASMNIKSAANYVGEVASDAVKSLQDANPFTTAQIPVPPPLPTKEDLNRHYLTKKVTRPSKKYSKSAKIATPVQTAAPKKAGVFSSLLNFAGNLVGKVENMASIHDRSLFSSSIPVPPPMPTKESTHKHYLIPLAPPMPTEEQTNQHYLSRNKSLEKKGSLLHNAAVFVREVVADVGEYITESPYELRPDEIPFPPPLPTRESTHKHYLSRDKKVENAQSYLMKAAHIAAEFVEDATGYVAIKGKQTYEALPTSAELSYVAGEAKEAVVEKTMNAVETVEHTVEASVENVKESVVHAKDVVVEKAVELKEAILPTAVVEKKPFHVPYPRYEVIDESSIFKAKPKTFYNRRILPRSSQDQRGDLSEVQMKMAQTMESLQIPSVFEYAGNQCYLPQQRKQMEDEQWNKIQSAF